MSPRNRDTENRYRVTEACRWADDGGFVPPLSGRRGRSRGRRPRYPPQKLSDPMMLSWERFERLPEVRRGETLENLMTYWLARLHQQADLYAMFHVTPSGKL